MRPCPMPPSSRPPTFEAWACRGGRCAVPAWPGADACIVAGCTQAPPSRSAVALHRACTTCLRLLLTLPSHPVVPRVFSFTCWHFPVAEGRILPRRAPSPLRCLAAPCAPARAVPCRSCGLLLRPPSCSCCAAPPSHRIGTAHHSLCRCTSPEMNQASAEPHMPYHALPPSQAPPVCVFVKLNNACWS